MKLLYRFTYLDDDLSDDVFSPLACRKQRRGAFRNKERSKTLLRTDLLPADFNTPLLPKLVHTDQAQNVSLALDMLPPLTVRPGDDPQHVDDDDPPPVEEDDPNLSLLMMMIPNWSLLMMMIPNRTLLMIPTLRMFMNPILLEQYQGHQAG